MTNRDTLRVLYVDDDRDIREIVNLSLSLDPSIELRAFDGGDAAIALLEKGGWTPDLVLLDVMMPKMTGPELMQELRARFGLGQAKFVFITARAREADRDTYIAEGAVGVIVKPFDPLTLGGVATRILSARAAPMLVGERAGQRCRWRWTLFKVQIKQDESLASVTLACKKEDLSQVGEEFAFD